MAKEESKEQLLARLNDQFEFMFEEALRNEMSEKGQLRKVQEGFQLMSIGQQITHMPIVLSGSIKIVMEDDKGDELLLYYLESGDTCAMTLNCCSRTARSTISAVTEQDSALLFLPVELLDEWMVRYSSWRNFVLESYNARMNEMLEAVDTLAFHNMEERLLKYLRDRAMVMHQGKLKITHYHIANDLHSSRVVISRLMKKLEREGLIKQYRNMVEVLEFSSNG